MIESQRQIALPLQIFLSGLFLGCGLMLLVLGQWFVAAVPLMVAGAVAWTAWCRHGWQIQHLDDVLQSIEALPIPIAIYDAADRLIVCNGLYTAHHSKAHQTLDLADRRRRPRYIDIIGAALEETLPADERDGMLKDWAAQQPPADGHLRERHFPNVGWLRVGKRALRNGGTVRVAIDINELKDREAELVGAVDHARRADAAKEKFFSTMTHELRTPLNGIIGMANILLLAQLDGQSRKNIEILRSSGVHLLDLVNRVLDYSKLSAPAISEVVEDFDLHSLLDDVVNELRFSHHAEGLMLKADIAPGTHRCWTGNRIGIRQILTNLAGNAVKFTERGSVTLRASGCDTHLTLAVIDTGIGIAPDDQDRIFEAFEQIDCEMTRRCGGTGLGLNICAEIAHAMGGAIELTSTPGEGSCFALTVPLAPVIHDGTLSIAS